MHDGFTNATEIVTIPIQISIQTRRRFGTTASIKTAMVTMTLIKTPMDLKISTAVAPIVRYRRSRLSRSYRHLVRRGDSNCDGASDYDQDGDGQDSDQHGGEDCNDTDGSIYLGATDTWYDGVDSNCDGANDFDQDGDGRVLLVIMAV